MKQSILISDDKRKELAIGIIKKLPLDDLHEVIVRPHKKDRSLSQNRLSHMHYSQIASQRYEVPVETKARCKLDYGIPILIAEDEDFAEKWNSVTKYLGREDLLKAVELIRVTSIMKVNAMTEYISAYMIAHEMQGIALSHPEDLYYEAMGLKR